MPSRSRRAHEAAHSRCPRSGRVRGARRSIRTREPRLLAGGVPLWAVSPVVVFPPAVFGGCHPPVPLSRVAASYLPCLCS